MTKRQFGQLELSILSLLKGGKRMTVKDVQSALGGQDKYTTVMTVMNRLVEKGRIGREKIGMHYEYWVQGAQPVAASFIAQLKKQLFNLKTSEMVSCLLESADDISDVDLEEMEKMIEKVKHERHKG